MRHVSHAILSLPLCCARPMFRLPMCLPSSARGVVFHILFVSFRKKRVSGTYVFHIHSWTKTNKYDLMIPTAPFALLEQIERREFLPFIPHTRSQREMEGQKKEGFRAVKLELSSPFQWPARTPTSRHGTGRQIGSTRSSRRPPFAVRRPATSSFRVRLPPFNA